MDIIHNYSSKEGISIYEGNEIIAKFMGEKIDLYKWGENWQKILTQYVKSETPEYNQSWDWLIPAYTKVHEKYKDKKVGEFIESCIRHNNKMGAFKTLVSYIHKYKKNKSKIK